MTAQPYPPIEWVPGPLTSWIVYLLAFPIGYIAVFVGAELLWPGSVGPSVGDNGILYLIVTAAAAGSIAMGLAQYFLPSLRRLGISPTALILDNGVTSTSYWWNQVRLSPVRGLNVGAGSSDPRSGLSHLRISRSMLWPPRGLSRHQSERLARFMGAA